MFFHETKPAMSVFQQTIESKNILLLYLTCVEGETEEEKENVYGLGAKREHNNVCVFIYLKTMHVSVSAVSNNEKKKFNIYCT
jgi:hypothetical protein